MASKTLWFYCSHCKKFVGTLAVSNNKETHITCGGSITDKVASKTRPKNIFAREK